MSPGTCSPPGQRDCKSRASKEEAGWPSCPPPTFTLRGCVRSAWPFPHVQKQLDPSLKCFSALAIYMLLICSLKTKAADFSRSRTNVYSGWYLALCTVPGVQKLPFKDFWIKGGWTKYNQAWWAGHAASWSRGENQHWSGLLLAYKTHSGPRGSSLPFPPLIAVW